MINNANLFLLVLSIDYLMLNSLMMLYLSVVSMKHLMLNSLIAVF